jgi:negative regulator of flagellin synthesis FlgM
MKITGYTPSELPASRAPSANTPKPETAAAKTAASAASDPGVAVVITGNARTQGKDAAGQASVIDTKKVAAMKAAIQDGSFKVNPEAIADKLLANAHELYNTAQK